MFVEDTPKLDIRDFSQTLRDLLKYEKSIEPLLEEDEEAQEDSIESLYCLGTFVLNRREYNYSIFLRDAQGAFSIVFKWRNSKGESLSEKVYLEERASSLGKSSFFLFICPYTQKRCRMLYVDSEGHLVGREGLKGLHYKCSYTKRPKGALSLLLSSFSALIDLEKDTSLKGQNRRPYRNGKLTRYGKRVEKYEAKMKRAVLDLEEAQKAFRARGK